MLIPIAKPSIVSQPAIRSGVTPAAAAAYYLAMTLKNLRHCRGMSLTQASEQSGVSKAMLGQIERNESSPTVATLWRIATGFNVPFSLFIAPESPEPRPGYRPPLQDMQVQPLFPFDPELRFDHFSITLGQVGSVNPLRMILA